MGKRIFITGATGYMGSRLLPRLIERGHHPVALVRASSKQKAPASCEIVVGDPLAGSSYEDAVKGADTFVHLVGVSHPSPRKAREFIDIDLRSAREAAAVAQRAGINHFVYVSVAHPAPVMQAYIEVRMQCEQELAHANLRATIFRPWYVLGPGHRWPYLLVPLYKLAALVPSTREGAIRLGLVTVEQMLGAMVHAIENPPEQGQRIFDPREIRRLARLTSSEVQQIPVNH